jgi:hypothetical protein
LSKFHDVAAATAVFLPTDATVYGNKCENRQFPPKFSKGTRMFLLQDKIADLNSYLVLQDGREISVP